MARDSKGVLYVVATPIGNLDDITLRAIKVLKQVQLVAAEDTRRTGILLRHFNIETAILSVHEHNERARIERISGRLAKGESVALVTDAGTPGIRIPGQPWSPPFVRLALQWNRSPGPARSPPPFRLPASHLRASHSSDFRQLGLKTANCGSQS
jgi:16S rRNA (cytidine1402-2'-O)-methyltransferase